MPQHTATTAQAISKAPATKPQGSVSNRKVQTWTQYELSEIKKKLLAAQVARRLQGVKTFTVYGNITTIDWQGVARDIEGNAVWSFEPGEHEGKTADDLKSSLETIFFYDRDIMESENILSKP